ncbi:hypothetical protein WCE37_07770 [Luteimonas sp. MJ250]|uniref:hypothetical protein n=1 Tax=Luteimonas sp. MJ250 TaxID=3129236 RepID=UPI0031BB6EE7
MLTSTMPPLLAASCVLALAAGLHVPDAEAAAQRSRYTRPSGICEAPLPVYDAHLRKAPLRVDNVGNLPVFVNCAMPSDPVGDVGEAWVEIHFASTAAASATVNCTVVTGSADLPVYDVRSRSIAPGSRTWFTWSGLDKQSADGLFAFMCSLAPGVQMTKVYASEEDSAGGI